MIAANWGHTSPAIMRRRGADYARRHGRGLDCAQVRTMSGRPLRESDWEGVQLHVVTGKGGTGKTTVAAALAIALSGEGRRTLLVEVENRQGIGTDAVGCLVDWLRGEDDVRVVRASVEVGNEPSRRLLVRLGFDLVGEADRHWLLELHA